MKPEIQIRLELLKKYYAYDENSKTFLINLHYEKVSEILCKEVKSVSDVPLMSDEFFDDIAGILKSIPHGYHAEICLTIDDYEGYDEKVILESFNDMLEFSRLKFTSVSRNKFYKVAILLAVGLILLFTGIFAEFEQWWHLFDNDKLIGELFTNFLEIAGWVFCWEAVSILFIEENEDMRQGSSVFSKINRIILSNKNNKALIDEEQEQIQKHFYALSPIKRVGYRLLVFSGFAFIGFASMLMIRSIFTVSDSVNNIGVLNVILNFLWIILTFIGGFCAVKLYSGKEKYRIPVAVYTFINFIVIIVMMVLSIIDGINVSIVTTNVIGAIIGIAYCLGFFFTHDKKKKQN